MTYFLHLIDELFRYGPQAIPKEKDVFPETDDAL